MTSVSSVADAPVWGSMAQEFAEIAATYFMVPVSIEGDPADWPAVHLAAGIKLVSARHQAELRIALSADEACASALAEGMFGEASAELEADMFKELANMWMGGVKTAFGESEIPFTGGLPVSLTPEKYEKYLTGSLLKHEFRLYSGEHRLLVQVGLFSRKNSTVIPPGLREGMILAKDVCNDHGLLMASAGTRLSQHSTNRLSAVLSSDKSVWVAGVVS